MMRVVVCVRRGLDGEIGPFDACAYEQALRLPDADVTLLCMGPASAGEWLHQLTRLGASRAVLLCDNAFAGADTLATAYTLSLALSQLSPDLVLCGRQTLVGDTGQTGAMLAVLSSLAPLTGVMRVLSAGDGSVTVETRSEGEMTAALPALLTVEKTEALRKPRLRSRTGELEVWDAARLGADRSKCGLAGSPTRVIETHENQSGKRKCRMIPREHLSWAIEQGLNRERESAVTDSASAERLGRVFIVGEAPRAFAESVGDEIVVLPLSDAEDIARRIGELSPRAVLWASDAKSKRVSAEVAALLGLGLCADCTRLVCEGGELMMIRPALSGSVIAKIKSLTEPAMATVRTDSGSDSRVIVGVGYGVKDSLDRARALADELGAELCASRRLVDNGYASYEAQVGLTGKTVSPPVYIAIGISGAVHHIAGMERAGTVIAINPDKDAPIFEYADYGILCEF